MTDASGVHQLHKYLAACLMHAARDLLPAVDLFVSEQTWLAGIAQAVRRRGGAFRDEQSGIGTQSVILCHQLVRYIAGCATARQRGHDDAIFQLQFAERYRSEQGSGHIFSLM